MRHLLAFPHPEYEAVWTLRHRAAKLCSFACGFLLVEPVGKAIPADVPTLWQRGVSTKAANMLPLLAPRALAVIVRSYCHRLLLKLFGQVHLTNSVVLSAAARR